MEKQKNIKLELIENYKKEIVKPSEMVISDIKVEGERVNEVEIEEVAPPLPTTLPPALANNITYEIV